MSFQEACEHGLWLIVVSRVSEKCPHVSCFAAEVSHVLVRFAPTCVYVTCMYYEFMMALGFVAEQMYILPSHENRESRVPQGRNRPVIGVWHCFSPYSRHFLAHHASQCFTDLVVQV